MVDLLGVHVDTTDYFHASNTIVKWANNQCSRYVCLANVHMLMEAHDSDAFKQIVNQADLVTSDGMPLVWMMRLKGQKEQQRVYGPTLMLHVLEECEREQIRIGFYGSHQNVLEALIKNLQKKYKRLNIAYFFSPPFRILNSQENAEIVKSITNSGVQVLFVGLGCPKQEIWMAEHRNKINAVMLGVGAAFDFHAKLKSQAPKWMQDIGLEWFFRFLTEPSRLWRRYIFHNPRFVILAIADLLGIFR
jgi:N-acetylglucosaminyldiphosphoundecaprenol N-acetyl-beta-D-mannosaminyltransferase